MSEVRNATLHHLYQDSVVLMEISRQLGAQADVEEAAVLMGTPANVQVLIEAGLLDDQLAAPSSDDVVIGVRARSGEAAEHAIDWARRALTGGVGHGSRVVGRPSSSEPAYRGWRGRPEDARLALISVPGPYAAAEAWKALRAGLHVFLFSDHVSVDDEIVLKDAARERGLLVMGPACGTACLSGMPLGFSNAVARGPIGLVAASGTGLQEVMCLIDRLGGGISQAIGTGGRDLSRRVAGRTMKQAIALLEADPGTAVITLISKPPDPHVAADVLSTVAAGGKPAVVCFIGEQAPAPASGLYPVRTLEEAARRAVELASTSSASVPGDPVVPPAGEPVQLRGLFCGGTLAYEALTILGERLGPVWSNVALDTDRDWQTGRPIPGHLCIDLGAEEFTRGRPHPMIDPAPRAQLLVEMARDPRVGVFLLDVVGGTGCHRDPAGAMVEAIKEARREARSRGGALAFVASVTATDADLSPRRSQVAALERAGVIVAPSNASAARVAARLVSA
ncbi:MAG: acyl-CoA synthetase FdrA [Chloroflexi bacterium]|nr:acyl-CoA synthetase FdrA [Chloroflexota bacterium]